MYYSKINTGIIYYSSYNAIYIYIIHSYIAPRGPDNCTDGEIRLAGEIAPTMGRVEICFGQLWGTICNRNWDSADADVVCRQLGFSSLGRCSLHTYSYYICFMHLYNLQMSSLITHYT